MRVTDLTKQNAVLRNINQNSERLQTLQENLSSGKRINRLSDDPVGATQVQDYRTRISYLDMLKHNIKQNEIWLETTEAELDHVAKMLLNTKTLILAQANDSSDADSRMVTAQELRNIEDAMIRSGNAKIGKVHLFAGSKTLTPPLVRNDEVSRARVEKENLPMDVKYLINTDQYKADFQGYSRNPYRVRITKGGEMGRAHYVVSDDNGSTWSREKTLLPMVEVVNESGKPSDKVTLRFQGELSDKLGDQIYFHPGLEYVFEPKPTVSYMGNEDKRMAPTGEGMLQPVNITAEEIFMANPDKKDTVNIFGLMHSLTLALEDNDRVVLEKRLDDIDLAYNQVLNKRADVGSIRKELNDRMDQILDRELNHIKQMSEIEDLDFPAALTEMNLADVRNKASLDTSSRLLQPSLLNFLR
ncbi:MAG: flagellin [Deltaproteobacteria bacterium]|nr:flagellin [Deltaproteobacteria bacterium]